MRRGGSQPRPSLLWLDVVKSLPLSDGDWVYSRRLRVDDLQQGWKLHLSATILSASEVLGRALPILRKYDTLFKIPSSFDLLAALNTGLTDYSQVGKFLTVYPRSTEEALELARELHRATRGLPAPRVPFDLPYRVGSVVHYRFGSFSNEGNICDLKGKTHPDKRAPGLGVPRWLSDPFQRTRRVKRRSRGPLGVDYLPFTARMQRGKGGVYEALDLTVSPPRFVIVKEGRRHGETAFDGTDGYARLRHEARILRRLRKAGAAVPEVQREFTQNGNRYVVLEKLAGRPLLSPTRIQPAKASWHRADKILNQLAAELARVHSAGWVWRDCKPSHVFVHRGRLTLIDFEGACRIGDTNVLPWGSAEYASVLCRSTPSRSAGLNEDLHALGVIAFQFTTGRFPAPAAARRAKLYARAGCPERVRSRIEELLRR